MKARTIFVVCLALSLAGCQPAGALSATGEYASGMGAYDRAFARLMAKWEVPGGALAVAKDGQILLARGYGLADVERDKAVQPEFLFRIASLSKPITAAAILVLVEEGRLSLDTPAFSLLQDLEPPAGQTVDPRMHAITIRHLLEHAGGWDASKGFEPMSEPQRVAQALGVPGPVDCKTTIRFMLGQPLDFDPGRRYAYSNYGYCVLGRVIEAVTGQSYEAYVRSQVLASAGIERMRLGGSLLPDRLPDEVRYYDDPGAPPAEPVFSGLSGPVPWPYGGLHLEAMDAHGGWVGSAVDLARFVYAVDAANPAPILQRETLDAMLARPAPPLWEGRSDYYALGWRVRPAGKRAAWWATGSMPGTTAVLYRTASGLAWAALFNARPDAPGDAFLVEVISAMGRAAIADEVRWIALSALALLSAVGVLAIRRVRKRKARRP